MSDFILALFSCLDCVIRHLFFLGEHLTESELAEYMSVLLGGDPANENEEDEESKIIKPLEDDLPEKITVDLFASEVLGFSAP